MPFHSTEKHGNHGFSFIELAIVLTIFGLLVGAIMQGKALMRASALQNVLVQLQTFTVADKAFRDKYQAVAGDMSTATTLWGAADSVPGQCVYTVGTGTQTCDGDGNGLIDRNSVSMNEIPRYWQHLANAGLILGIYNGVGSDDSNCCYVIPTNAPSGKLSKSLWMPFSTETSPLSYQFGGQSAAWSTLPASTPTSNIFAPEELWNIDKKIDDGMPLTGQVQGSYSGTNNCTTGSTTADTYLLTYSDIACWAQFYVQQP